MAISWDTPNNSSAGGSGGIKWDNSSPSVAQSNPQSIADQVWGSIANYGHNVANTVNQAGQNVNAAITQPGESSVEQGINASGAAASGIVNTAASIIPGGKSILGAIGKGFNGLTGIAANVPNYLADASQSVGLMSPQARSQYDANNAQFANSSAGKAIERTAKVGQSLGNVSNVILGAKGLADTAQSGVNLIKDTSNKVGAINTVAKQMAPTKPAPVDPEVSQIQDTIAPKLDKAETQAALLQGRLSRAPEGGLRQWVFGKSPDTVSAAEETTQAAQTIKDNIPGAANMDDAQLHGALADKTTQMAQELEPKMQAVQVKPETVDGITSAWEKLKETQSQEPEFDAYPGSVKAQAKFDKYLSPFQEKSFNSTMNESLGAGPQVEPTLDDIWQSRKDYDASIASNVKNATTASSPSLQWQKTMWLQNRSILSSAINDAETGLGAESKGAFSDMHDMYNAQQNILSKVKVDTKGTPGVAGHIGKSLFKWGVGLGLGALGLKEFTH